MAAVSPEAPAAAASPAAPGAAAAVAAPPRFGPRLAAAFPIEPQQLPSVRRVPGSGGATLYAEPALAVLRVSLLEIDLGSAVANTLASAAAAAGAADAAILSIYKAVAPQDDSPVPQQQQQQAPSPAAAGEQQQGVVSATLFGARPRAFHSWGWASVLTDEGSQQQPCPPTGYLGAAGLRAPSPAPPAGGWDAVGSSSPRGSPRAPSPSPLSFQQQQPPQQQQQQPPQQPQQQQQQQQQQVLHVSARCWLASDPDGARSSPPVPVARDGRARLARGLFLVAHRPLSADASLVLELRLHAAADSPARLGLRIRWPLAALLAASPPRPERFREWVAVRDNCAPGLQLPLEGLPGGWISLAVFAADLDEARVRGLPADPLTTAVAAAARGAGRGAWDAHGGACDPADDAWGSGGAAAAAAAAHGAGQAGRPSAALAAAAVQSVRRRMRMALRRGAHAAESTQHALSRHLSRSASITSSVVARVLGTPAGQAAAGSGSGGASGGPPGPPAALAVLQLSILEVAWGGDGGGLPQGAMLVIKCGPHLTMLDAASLLAPAQLTTAAGVSGGGAAAGRGGAGSQGGAAVTTGTPQQQRQVEGSKKGDAEEESAVAQQAGSAAAGSLTPKRGQWLLRRRVRASPAAEPSSPRSGTGSGKHSSGGPFAAAASATAAGSRGPSEPAPALELLIPIFSPRLGLDAVLWWDPLLGPPAVVGDMHYRAFGLLPLLRAPRARTLRLKGPRRDDAGQRETVARLSVRLAAHLPGAAPVAAAGADGDGGGGGGGGRLGWLAIFLLYLRLWGSYLQSPLGRGLLAIGALSDAAARDELQASYADAVCEWLAAAQPPIPEVAARRLLGTGRHSFSLDRLRANVARIRDALSALPPANPDALRSWERPGVNLALIYGAYVLCFKTRAAVLLSALALCSFMCWRLAARVYYGGWAVEVEEGSAEDAHEGAVSAADGGVAAAPGGGTAAAAGSGGGPNTSNSPGTDRSPDGGGAASPAAAAGTAAALSAAAGAGLGQAAGVGGAPVLGTPPAAAARPRFRHQNVVTTVRNLHAQYTSGQLTITALAVQNALETVASAIERALGLILGLEPVASSLFYAAVLTVAAAVARFGPGPVVFAFVLFLLRPPFLRGIPGALGGLPLLANLPVRGVEWLSS